MVVTTRITVKNAETGSSVEMELEAENTVEEIIESAASYWEVSPGAYVLRRGKAVLRGQSTIVDAEIREGDVVELIPDPEGG